MSQILRQFKLKVFDKLNDMLNTTILMPSIVHQQILHIDSFSDGNKRIAAAVFLYFLDKNDALFTEDGEKIIDDHTLVALVIMIAESWPVEKELMISIIMNCLTSEAPQA